MPEPARRYRFFRFGIFELDSSTLELRKNGKTEPRLREQALQVLLTLLDRPREVVTREELQRRLWSADTFVDFDHGLNAAINQLRNALGDSAANPRFIQTLPRRGYRFIAPVEVKDGLGDAQVSIVNSEARVANEKRMVNVNQASVQPLSRSTDRNDTVSQPPRRSVLSDPQELPNASRNVVRILFSLIQVMYLSFYVVSLARLPRLEVILNEARDHALLILIVLIIAAAVGIPIRLYLLAAATFNYDGLSNRFQKLFPFLFPLDELWALAPFLIVSRVGFGSAIAMTAALLYLPFAQRSLLLMGFSAERK